MTTLMCLAIAVHFEARGETQAGQMAVAQVVMNRVEDSRYPDTVCDVVFEGTPKVCQFSFVCDAAPHTLPDNAAGRRSLAVAEDVLEGETYPTTATHYHTTGVAPDWRTTFDFDERIGDHLFYTNNTPYR